MTERIDSDRPTVDDLEDALVARAADLRRAREEIGRLRAEARRLRGERIEESAASSPPPEEDDEGEVHAARRTRAAMIAEIDSLHDALAQARGRIRAQRARIAALEGSGEGASSNVGRSDADRPDAGRADAGRPTADVVSIAPADRPVVRGAAPTVVPATEAEPMLSLSGRVGDAPPPPRAEPEAEPAPPRGGPDAPPLVREAAFAPQAPPQPVPEGGGPLIPVTGVDDPNPTATHLATHGEVPAEPLDGVAPGAASVDADAPRVEQESRGKAIRRALRTAPLTAWFGMIVIVLYALVAIFADVLAPYSETENPGRAYQMPDGFAGLAERYEIKWERMTGQIDEEEAAERFDALDDTFALGTDRLGRDMLSRMVYAAQNTVGIALLTTVLAFLLGGLLGMVAGVFGGWIDTVLSRIVDVLMAIPQLIFALLLLTVFGIVDLTIGLGGTALGRWLESVGMGWATGWTFTIPAITMVLVIAVLDSTRVYRLTRAVTMNVVVMDYVEAAKLRGEGTWHLIRREILPNAAAPLIAEFGLRFCFVFLTIAALSFLGLGLQPPTADWGSMVGNARDQILQSGWNPGVEIFPLLPAGAIALLAVAVNFVVDWMLHRSSGLKE